MKWKERESRRDTGLRPCVCMWVCVCDLLIFSMWPNLTFGCPATFECDIRGCWRSIVLAMTGITGWLQVHIRPLKVAGHFSQNSSQCNGTYNHPKPSRKTKLNIQVRDSLLQRWFLTQTDHRLHAVCSQNRDQSQNWLVKGWWRHSECWISRAFAVFSIGVCQLGQWSATRLGSTGSSYNHSTAQNEHAHIYTPKHTRRHIACSDTHRDIHCTLYSEDILCIVHMNTIHQIRNT